ncbi:MAG: hypothetical protein ACN6PW_02600 [Pseudomonas kermanshahensis]|uniref:hypothetical protein n=1 Tax=Pseudomonas kermanshahensis TaxID=2745482 RepID=UPI003D0FC605
MGKRGDEALGHNVILFNKASGVQGTELKYRAEYSSLWVTVDEGEYYSPQIWAAKDKGEEKPNWWAEQPPVPRHEPALALDREAIRIHRIKWVDFDTDEDLVGYNT